MKTIIVPIDFSNESLSGLNLSLMLANKTGANIQMVHVIKKNSNSNIDQLGMERQLAELKFKDILQKYKKKLSSNISLNYAIREGKVFREINELSDIYDDVLIVLTTYGESGFDELFIGSNAHKIISHSKNPVITLRRKKTIPNIDKIVIPLDITYQTREKIPYSVMLAKLFHSEIHLLSVRPSNVERIEKKLVQYTEQVASYIKAQNIPLVIEHLKGDNLTDLTLDYSRSVDADLISIMTEQEKSVSNILIGSHAEQMINKAFIPVLSFPNYQLRINTEDIRDIEAFNSRN